MPPPHPIFSLYGAVFGSLCSFFLFFWTFLIFLILFAIFWTFVATEKLKKKIE